MLDKKRDFVLVDSISPDKYAEGHILGSLNIPFDKDFEKNFRKLVPSKSEFVVVYSSDGVDDSSKAIEKASKMKYTNLYYYKGSLKDWKRSGGEVHSHLIGEEL